MKTIIVAGGAGFLGSHLCDELVKENKVICVDNLITGFKDNIKHLLSNRYFDYVQMDICSKEFFDKFSKIKIDRIYNMASPASPVDYVEYPIETLMAGSMGAKNLLDLALIHKARILVASTSEIYGDPLEHPQKEEYWGNVNPIGVRSCYDEAKRFMEAITSAYKRKHNVSIRIVRIFNTYGPRMRLTDGRVVPNFISQALKGEPLTIYGDGSYTRSFCYVSDLVAGLMALMDSDVDTPVNLGNPEERTILEFAKTIMSLVSSKSSIKYMPALPDDPKKRCPDISKAKKLLGWNTRIDLKTGISKTIDYFKSRINVD
ncbi:MAG: SDR family oxidoreductase [Proteobacteria bacterium]|nr:SDR family oxidoreductase [Pseudomonadota bacterium]